MGPWIPMAIVFGLAGVILVAVILDIVIKERGDNMGKRVALEEKILYAIAGQRGLNLYAWFWWHTQFWLDPDDRRPYTFIMRDWIYPHMVAYLVISAVWYTWLFFWAHWNPYWPLALGIPTSMLWAHLVWGTTWVPGQQEDPPYNEYDGRSLPQILSGRENG